jgi:transcription antitermination protein NusB
VATRSQARQSVVELLYAYEVGNKDIIKSIDILLENKKIRNKQKEFAINIFNGVLENIDNIDKSIIENLSKRGIDDLGMVEKSILRLSIYEIMYQDLDKAIIINEAIELSKKMAYDTAPKFINALLDKINKIT